MRDAPGDHLAPPPSPTARGNVEALAYRSRVYLLLVATCAVMAAIAPPSFLTVGSFANILKAAGVNLLAGIGFTLVMISGQLDLAIGSAMTLGGLMAVGLQPPLEQMIRTCGGAWPGGAVLVALAVPLSWAASMAVALLCGLALGLANGLLVAKARINSFIVTLGTMIIVQNAVLIFCSQEGTIPVPPERLALPDWFQHPVALKLTPQILLPFLVMVLLAVFLRRTAIGRGFYLLGGNPQTAWYSGLHVDRYVIGAFVLSGVLSVLGGAIVAISEANANPTLGDKSLMTIVAAVIIGGTSMQGGKGSFLGTTVALVALAALINGLNCRGEGYEVQLMAGGLVLASIILYDAYSLALRERKRGQRLDLVKELILGAECPRCAVQSPLGALRCRSCGARLRPALLGVLTIILMGVVSLRILSLVLLAITGAGPLAVAGGNWLFLSSRGNPPVALALDMAINFVLLIAILAIRYARRWGLTTIQIALGISLLPLIFLVLLSEPVPLWLWKLMGIQGAVILLVWLYLRTKRVRSFCSRGAAP
jgi:ribose transport system permease protein